MLLKVVPHALRQHLQLQLDEDATYGAMREKILAYERTTTSFSSRSLYQELHIKEVPRQDEAVPMDIDRVVWKGKDGKKGKKGKGKFGEKGGKNKRK